MKEENEIENSESARAVVLNRLVIKILPEVASVICMKIKDYFFYNDIKQEIVLSFLESGINRPDRGLAFKFGWQAVERFRKRYEINYSTLTKNYTDEFNLDEAISKLNKIGTVIRDRREDFYRENIIAKIWELRANGLTFKEIGAELKINSDTAENYFKRSIHDQSIDTDIKYKALKQKRRRNNGKEKAMIIINELKKTNDPMAEIAKRNKIHPATVSRINNGFAWNFLAENYPIRQNAL